MKDIQHSERVDVTKLDAEAIQQFSSDIARMLASLAGENHNLKIHIKLGHGKVIEHSRNGFTRIINPEAEPAST